MFELNWTQMLHKLYLYKEYYWGETDVAWELPWRLQGSGALYIVRCNGTMLTLFVELYRIDKSADCNIMLLYRR